MSAAAAPSPWLRCAFPKAGATVRLVCLPHAGGAASFFRTWGRDIGDEIEVWGVQYPGRENRINDAFPADLTALAGHVAEAVAALDDRPVVLFGHSLGSLVAYETARRLEAGIGPDPGALVVSGMRAPSRRLTGDVHLRDDEAVVDELVRLGGTDGELLRDQELRELFLPAIRTDYRFAETYRPAPGPLLRCPVTAVIGTEDTEVDDALASAWQEVTAASFALHRLPGDHFYLVPHAADVLALLRRVTLRADIDTTGRSTS
ncbi:thioesterase II family protein [Prauserella cavernicola]|uniref:Thioesterase n=1 Tax=Prauserella cavernicola TaxID=2800127 RepID=A0A934QNX1_9PSEU|nr:alpha/beta fold hydrolase [Prauserella cavernicola]MBK1783690.1 thioesterase [Prauserella cavernicola]